MVDAGLRDEDEIEMEDDQGCSPGRDPSDLVGLYAGAEQAGDDEGDTQGLDIG
jgi:hypothetical protein